jgi:hypothetical protein
LGALEVEEREGWKVKREECKRKREEEDGEIYHRSRSFENQR